MAGSGKGKTARLVAATAGISLVAGGALAHWGGSEGFGDRAHQEVDKYVTGQPFDRGAFERDTLKGPVAKATLEAAIRGALRQYGEEDAYKPGPEARAVVLCAGAAANKLALPDDVRNNFIAGGRFEDADNGEAADAAYAVAADGCQAALDGALGGDLVIPVDDK